MYKREKEHIKIHKMAIVHPSAVIAEDVEIGPFSIIEENVSIGKGTIIKNNVTIKKNTTLGENNIIHTNAVLGMEPQDFKYKGEGTDLVMGNNNVVREGVTINIGTAEGGGKTVIGNNNFFMAYAHIAHDCIIEDNVLLANGVLLGGHVYVEKGAKLMGLVGVQPFVTIGCYAYVGGLSRIVQDVPPYIIVEGHPAKVRQVNVIGLQRESFSAEQIDEIKKVFRLLFRSKKLTRRETLDFLEKSENLSPEIAHLVTFLRNMDKGKFGRYRESLRQHARLLTD